MSVKKIRILGGSVLVFGLIPAVGPLYLGLVRDDIHAHSAVGDLGLQAITISGILIVLSGFLLIFESRRRESDRS
jgi:hypothetical protein